MEVSAHRGARDKGIGPENHKSWQGKCYHIGGDKTVDGVLYPDFERVTGYGTGEGLAGWNCRHHWTAYIPGVMERTYTDEELANIDPPDFEFEGKTYTAYEATQKQRQLETAMRAQERKMNGYKAAGDEEAYTYAKAKYRALSAEYKKFSKAADLPEQRQRLKIAESSQNSLAIPNNNVTIGAGGDAVTIRSIDSPIESARNSSRGKPGAITHFDAELNTRQKELLDQLPDFDSRVMVEKDAASMTDLSALTAKTGDEFAMFTKEGNRLIVRGNTIKVNITLDEARELAAQGYSWSGHTHPGTDKNCLVASQGDIDILQCFPQLRSVIYNSVGEFLDFWKE